MLSIIQIESLLLISRMQKKYQIGYHSQFYWSAEKKTLKHQNTAVFLGKNKGRVSILNNLYPILIHNDLTPVFHVVKDKFYQKNDIFKLQSRYLPYHKSLEILNSSKLIIEINKSSQSGLTMRSLEALFLNKKLITNNRDIINYDFYLDSNIYILGVDNNIKEFLNREFKEIDIQIKNKYSVNHWLENLLESIKN